jgi:uncharacterized membrane protein YdjX (TVP38/TMEM64 family)
MTVGEIDDRIRRLRASTRTSMAISALMLVFILFFLYVGYRYASWDMVLERWRNFMEWTSTHPLLLIFTMGIMTSVGIPASCFYVLCGGAYGVRDGIVISGLGLTVNLLFSYGLYHFFFYEWIIKRLCRHERLLGDYARTKVGKWKWIVAIRLMLPIPLCVQTCILSVMEGIPFIPFFVLSWLIQMGWACACVVGGKDWLHGHIGIVGIVSVVSAYLVLRVSHRYTKNVKGDVVVVGGRKGP